MTTQASDLARAAAHCASSQNALVTCHLGPDGDAVGSMSALTTLLRAQGKKVTLYNPDPVPRTLRWLPQVATLVHRLPVGTRYDVTFVCDCGDRKLVGESFPASDITGPLVVLDHHAFSRPFGDVYLCDPSAPAAGVLVARLAETLGWPILPEAAEAIYVSLVADTGFFRYANTTAEAFRLAHDFVDRLGVDPWKVAEALGERVPLSRYRLLAAALATIQIELDGQVAVMTVTEEMVRAAGAAWEDTEGLVNYTRSIEGVECGVLFTPAKDKRVRVSLRSRGRRINAGAVVMPFGGGGHSGAAGCRLEGTLAEARARILAALQEALSAGQS